MGARLTFPSCFDATRNHARGRRFRRLPYYTTLGVDTGEIQDLWTADGISTRANRLILSGRVQFWVTVGVYALMKNKDSTPFQESRPTRLSGWKGILMIQRNIDTSGGGSPAFDAPCAVRQLGPWQRRDPSIQALRAGQKAAWEQVPCHGDIFHAEKSLEELCTVLARHAEACTAARRKIGHKYEQIERSCQRPTLGRKLARVRRAEDKAATMAADVRVPTGQRHPHWLEILDYTRFRRN
jgi:hypothetical protein